jgi:hypothetical protein
MNSFIQLQYDLEQMLLSADALASINIVAYRKLRMQSEIDWSSIWNNPRNGRSGCGILVETPAFEVQSPNVSGPIGDLVLSCAVIEEPNLNLEPAGGTLLSSEQVCQIILDQAHQWAVVGSGTLYADVQAIAGAPEFKGLVAYRVRLRIKQARVQTQRCALPTVSETTLTVTLACATPGAAIYFTQDGSYPGPGNPGAAKYGAPFQQTGQTLRYCAYAANFVQSAVGYLFNPAAPVTPPSFP